MEEHCSRISEATSAADIYGFENPNLANQIKICDTAYYTRKREFSSSL